jgi:O-antigen biosynthesis alpha-1,2-rhamnosyltransferase
MEFISYTHNFADVMLYRAFRDVKAGFYIDVGAGDPNRDSVTRAFYERGWHGINIEPAPEHYTRLTAERPRDLNLNVAAGAEAGLVTLFARPGAGLAAQAPIGSPEKLVAALTEQRTVRQIPLRQICQQYAPAEVHFVKIGVGGGGGEGRIIAGTDFGSFRPYVLLVDATPQPHEAGPAGWDSLLTAAGYCFVWFDGQNRYYVAEERLAALGRYFLPPPNGHDRFRGASGEAAVGTTDPGVAAPIARSTEPDARIGRAERRLAQERAARISAEARASRAEIAQLAAQAEITALRDSASWRVTAPLRAVMWRLHRRRRAAAAAAEAETQPDEARPRRRTLYVECTHTYVSDVNTGIQRVVRNVLRYAPEIAAQYGFDVVPVILENGRFIVADLSVVLSDKQRRRLERLQQEMVVQEAEQTARRTVPMRHMILKLCRPAWRGFIWTLARLLPFAPVVGFLYAPPGRFGLAGCILFPWRLVRGQVRFERPAPPVSPDLDLRPVSAADALLLLDSSWHLPVWPAVQRFKMRGGMVISVAYDLIPISHPEACVPELVASFEQWFRNVTHLVDGYVAISQATAAALADYLTGEGGRARHQPPIAHFYLGSELDFHLGDEDVRPAIRDMFRTDAHVFLMVGSIEPRKKHAFVLDAFDRLWAAGGDGCLVIIGRQGWRTEDLLERIGNHPESGKRLHVLRDASDSELDHAYRNASALIIASEAEGFGLPVVEAFQRGLPVLCSDIPVFREIADGRATFFSLDHPDRLACAIMDFATKHDPATRWERSPTEWLTWRESTVQLFAAMAPHLGVVPEMCEPGEIVHEPATAPADRRTGIAA